jgi:hypothetical protein
MSAAVPHVSRLVPPGPTVRPPGTASEGLESASLLARTVGGDPVHLGALLADVEPLRADEDAVIETDADAEVVRFLAVLAVLEGRAPMPAYDLADPSLKWHAPAGVRAVPNPPSLVGRPASGPVERPADGAGAAAGGGAA